MPLFKTKMKQTFSFAKLNRSIDKIIKEAVDGVGKAQEMIYKQRIDNVLTPPLRPFTLKMRKKGIGWDGKKVPPTSSDTPLKQTGSLYKSLTYIKSDQTIKMFAYGKKHNDGFPNPHPKAIDVPARQFLQEGAGLEKTLFEVPLKAVRQKLRKAFKK